MQLRKRFKQFLKRLLFGKYNNLQIDSLDYLGENTEILGSIDKRCHDSVIKIGRDCLIEGGLVTETSGSSNKYW